jgi:hypothetical protein
MELRPDSVPPEHWARLLEDMPWLGIASSPLAGVIAVGRSSEANGVTDRGTGP